MFESVITIILALFGLGLLIFVHELGHYYVARWVGMRVDVFSIGFGRPIKTWERKGVRWQICMLPFGGYVKIAGMEPEDNKEPHEISDGFFGKTPFARIKVAFAGPGFNLIFALLMFTLLWGMGGREKNFSYLTHSIGWVDQESELFSEGVRPGDTIAQYGKHPFKTAKDHLYAPMLGGKEVRVQGYSIDHEQGKKEHFDHTIKPYPHPEAIENGILTTGIVDSSEYILYDRLPGERENPLPLGSPIKDAGLEYGDRIYWVDGELIFSRKHLKHLLNDSRALLTIQRGDQQLLVRVPRVGVGELKLDTEHREELIDWQYESQLRAIAMIKLQYIPYNLDHECIVENTLKFIDPDDQEVSFPKHVFSDREHPLQPGDRILAVDGQPVQYSYELLSYLQERRIHIIVDRGLATVPVVSWKQADNEFEAVHAKKIKDVAKLAATIGGRDRLTTSGTLHLLKPVVPKTRKEIAISIEKQAELAAVQQKQKKMLEKIESTEQREQALQAFEKSDKELLLGIPAVQDRRVQYNPGPLCQFYDVFKEIWRTLSALVSGYLSPKFISGPIGIVQVIQVNWMISIKEVLFWLAAISVNLGILNLLPIPVLDGGYICMSIYEIISGRRLKPKTMEKLVIPFAILLIGFLVYLTFNDLSRIFGRFF